MAETRTLTTQKDLQKQIQEDLAQRIAEHQAAVAKRTLLPLHERPLNLLATGDSWFDYPLSSAWFGPPSDVIVQLRRKLALGSLILSLAHAGDATTAMLGVTKRQRLVEQLNNPNNGAFDGILFSGGGNDLAGEQFRLWINDAPAGERDVKLAINQAALKQIIGVVKTAYLDLIQARNSRDKTIPIFVHGYDFGPPNGTGVCWLGPWTYPSLHDRRWMKNHSKAEIAIGLQIVSAILLEFDKLLVSLSKDRQNNLVYVRTQGTLKTTEWANELHPKPGGFAKIADKFVDAFHARWQDRAVAAPARAKPRRLGPRAGSPPRPAH